MTATHVFSGGCHCGKLRVALETAISPAYFHPRACDCRFCIKHGATYISDPQGRLSIEVQGLDVLGEYLQLSAEEKRGRWTALWTN